MALLVFVVSVNTFDFIVLNMSITFIGIEIGE